MDLGGKESDIIYVPLLFGLFMVIGLTLRRRPQALASKLLLRLLLSHYMLDMLSFHPSTRENYSHLAKHLSIFNANILESIRPLIVIISLIIKSFYTGYPYYVI